MQGKKHLIIASGLAALAFTSSAIAFMSVPAGWYLEGNAGSTHVSNQSNFNGGRTSNSGIGLNLDVGYKFMPYVGTEIGYTQYANTFIKNNNGTKAATVKNYSYDLALRGILPIGSSGFELFAKLGVGRMNTKISIDNQAAASGLGIGSGNHNATGLYMGIGGQYYFMPELAANVQWARMNGNNSTGNFDLVSVGFSFIFD